MLSIEQLRMRLPASVSKRAGVPVLVNVEEAGDSYRVCATPRPKSKLPLDALWWPDLIYILLDECEACGYLPVRRSTKVAVGPAAHVECELQLF
jgi:hypothetical protein